MEISQAQVSVIEGYFDEKDYEAVLELLQAFTTGSVYPPRALLDVLVGEIYFNQTDDDLTSRFDRYLGNLHRFHSPWTSSTGDHIWTPAPVCRSAVKPATSLRENDWKRFVSCLDRVFSDAEAPFSVHQAYLYLNRCLGMFREDFSHIQDDNYRRSMLCHLISSASRNATNLRAPVIGILKYVASYYRQITSKNLTDDRGWLLDKLLAMLYTLHLGNALNMNFVELAVGILFAHMSKKQVLLCISLMTDIQLRMDMTLGFVLRHYAHAVRHELLEGALYDSPNKFLSAFTKFCQTVKLKKKNDRDAGDEGKIGDNTMQNGTNTEDVYDLSCFLLIIVHEYIHIHELQASCDASSPLRADPNLSQVASHFLELLESANNGDECMQLHHLTMQNIDELTTYMKQRIALSSIRLNQNSVK